MTDHQTPLVTIAINNYNYGEYLGSCIRSALEQTYSRVEVVVVDDGSSDDSREVIESFSSRVVALFKPNAGQASALNAGFVRSSGEIVLMLDSDDLLYPDVVARIVRAWRAGVAKVQFQLDVIDRSGERVGACIPTTLHQGDVTPIIRRFGGYASPPCSGNAYSRRVLEKFFPMPEAPWKWGADTYPIILSPFFGEVLCLEEPGGCYRINSNPGKSQFVMNNRPTSPSDALTRLERSRALIGAELKTRGFIHEGGFLLEPPTKCRVRLISRVIDGRDSPAYEIPIWRIISGSMRSIWSWPDYTVSGKLLYSAWFLVVAIMPLRLAAPFIVWTTSPEQRPGWLRNLSRYFSRWRRGKHKGSNSAPSRATA
jgi:glycosyltransferase involved in cell wall biosynthesis